MAGYSVKYYDYLNLGEISFFQTLFWQSEFPNSYLLRRAFCLLKRFFAYFLFKESKQRKYSPVARPAASTIPRILSGPALRGFLPRDA